MPNADRVDKSLVAVLVYDGLATFEYGIAAEIFGLPRPEMGPDWYRMITCARRAGPLRAQGGISIIAEAGLDALATAGTIVVPGWHVGAEPDAELSVALRAASSRGARIVSICSGAFALADAGLLDGRSATTHWRYAEAFHARFPQVRLVPEVLYVDEGDVLTSAGSSAGLDLLLHIVRTDFGAEAANSVARRLVMAPHRDGGQAQLIERPVPKRPNGRLSLLLDVMLANLHKPLTVSSLARDAAMSERTFLRRFKEFTGKTPAAWLLNERLLLAKELLEDPALPLEEIAATAGFGTSATMRMHFKTYVGIGPSEFRRRLVAVEPKARSGGSGLGHPAPPPDS